MIKLIFPVEKLQPAIGESVTLSVSLSEDETQIYVTEIVGRDAFSTTIDVAELLSRPVPRIMNYRLDRVKMRHYSLPRMAELTYNNDAQSFLSIVANPDTSEIYLVVGRGMAGNVVLGEGGMTPEIVPMSEIDSLGFCNFQIPVDPYTRVRRYILSRMYMVDNVYLLEKQVDIQNKLILQMADALAAHGITLPEEVVGYVRQFEDHSVVSQQGMEDATAQVVGQKQYIRQVQAEAEQLLG